MRHLPILLALACAANPEGSEPDPDDPTDTSEPEPEPAFDCAPDQAALLDGVARIEPGAALPSRLVVHGEGACPIVADTDGRVLVASARRGAGRVAVASHESLLTSGAADAGALVGNLATWAGGDAPRIGVDPGYGGLVPVLGALGLDARVATSGELADLDLWFTTAYPDRPEAERDAILAWVDAGGGLVVGGHAWWWAYERGADGPTTALGHPGNRLLDGTGLTISPEMTAQAPIGVAAPGVLRHAARALDAAEDHLAGRAPLALDDQRTAADTVGFTARNLPLVPGPWLTRLRALLDGSPAAVPTRQAPIDAAGAPIDALVVTIATVLGNGLGPDALFAIPAAFPGPVAEGAARGPVRSRILASYGGMDGDYAYAGAGSPVWRSTGAYAAPGEVVTVTVPAAWVGRGLSVQIGAHTDTLWHLESWRRHPAITRSVPIDAAEIRVGSGFGGPVYVRVPAGLDLGPGEVTVDGAVAMPRFVLGETDPTAFRAAVAAAAAPLTEIEGPSLIFTVPTADVPRNLDAAAYASFWEEIQAVNAWLAAIPARPRPERIAMDVQISAGWMHSGYPLMAYDHGPALLDLARLRAEGDWGAFHELGHNHQFGPANLPGTTECTVNLWSVIAMEEVVGRDRGLAHEALRPSDRAARIDAYLRGGRDFGADWNVWTCLETWLQIQETYGWEPFRAVNEAHRALPRGSRPGTDADRVADHVRRYSRETGRDLTPFHAAWGFPLSDGLRAELADLPPWADHPLAGR
jgi:hypothetical protein